MMGSFAKRHFTAQRVRPDFSRMHHYLSDNVPIIQHHKENGGHIPYENSSDDRHFPGRLDRPASLYPAENGNFHLNARCLSGDGQTRSGDGKPDSGNREIDSAGNRAADGAEEGRPAAGCRRRRTWSKVVIAGLPECPYDRRPHS